MANTTVSQLDFEKNCIVIKSKICLIFYPYFNTVNNPLFPHAPLSKDMIVKLADMKNPLVVVLIS